MSEEGKNAALLREIVSAYTTRPEAIEIEVKPNPRGELMQLRVAAQDHAKVIGGGGKQIQALRTIFEIIGARDKRSVKLVLLEPDRGGETYGVREPRARPDLDYEVAQRLLEPDSDGEYDPEATLALLDKVLARVLVKEHRTDIYDAEDKVHLEVHPSADEKELAELLVEYAAPIFHAIGKRMGRDLYLETKPVVPI